MMLETYFKCERTRTQYYAGAAGPYLDGLAQWFEENGYQGQTVRRRIVGAAQFATWAEASGWTVPELDAAILDAFGHHLAQQDQLRGPSGDHTVRFFGRSTLSSLRSGARDRSHASRHPDSASTADDARRFSDLDADAARCHRTDSRRLPRHSP